MKLIIREGSPQRGEGPVTCMKCTEEEMMKMEEEEKETEAQQHQQPAQGEGEETMKAEEDGQEEEVVELAARSSNPRVGIDDGAGGVETWRLRRSGKNIMSPGREPRQAEVEAWMTRYLLDPTAMENRLPGRPPESGGPGGRRRSNSERGGSEEGSVDDVLR